MVEPDVPQPHAEANARIARAVAALPDYDDPTFWPTVTAGIATLPNEALVHILQEFRALGRDDDVNRAMDLLIQRAYAIAIAIIRKRLRSRPRDHEDAVRQALAAMWRELARGDAFWERNFVGALQAECLSACRTYLGLKYADKPAADFADPMAGNAIVEGGRPGASVAATSVETAIHNVMYEQALSTLEPLQRDVWSLTFDEGLTHAEAAMRLGLSKEQVRDRLRKAKERLAAFYNEGGVVDHGN
jgi:RNA polymerase sigma factor (sigma-70 family)